jgi:hypothetical protein
VAGVNDCGVYGTVHSLFRRLPPSWRTGLKRTLGRSGHGRSNIDWLTARKDATGKKRLDRALEGLISTLGPDTAQRIAGKTCIDFGAGYVPTDGVALWLLGAREVHGVDYNNIARPTEIARAVRAADADRVGSHLQSLAIDSGWVDRLDRLRRWALAGSHEFPPGYTYVAPADVIASPSVLPKFDVLVSTSVLEHIPPSLMTELLDALKSRENDNATQFHRVDLRDHRDFDNAPYGFLDPSKQFDADLDADSRGNGMTLHDWEALLASHPEWGLGVSGYEAGRRHLMPAAVAVSDTHVVADSLVLRSITAGTMHEARGI